MNLSSAKYGISSLKEKQTNPNIMKSLDMAYECIEIVQKLQSNNCEECRLKVNDGGERCLLLSPPHDFCSNGVFNRCPLRIKR